MRAANRFSAKQLVLFLISLILLCLFAVPFVANGSILRVPEDFETIQEALQNALSGDSVDVAGGTYHELLNLPGGVPLISREGPETTLLNGMCMGPIITFQDQTEAVTLSGFTLREGMDPSGSAISQNGGLLRIYDCIFEDNIAVTGGSAEQNGIIFSTGATLLRLERCTFKENRSESEISHTVVARNIDRLTLEHCIFLEDPSSETILEDLNLDAVGTIRLEYNLFTSPVRMSNTSDDLTMLFNSFTAELEIGGTGDQSIENNLFYNAGSFVTHYDDSADGICNAFWNTTWDWSGSCATTSDPLVCDSTDLRQGVHIISALAPGRHRCSSVDCGEIGGLPLACDHPLLFDSEPSRISYAGGEEITMTGYALDTATSWYCLGPDGVEVPFFPFVTTDTETAAFLSPLNGAPVGYYDIEASFPPDNLLSLVNAFEIRPGELEQSQPDHSRNIDSLWIRIDGFPLLSGLEMWMEHNTTGQIISPLETSVWEPDSARVLLSLLDAPLGKYDLFVRNPNDDLLELEAGFTIIDFDTLYVPQDFETIQEAIDAAGDGITIYVDPGIYRESVSFQGKSVRLMSTQGPETTVITAHELGQRVVTIQDSCGSFAELHGFTIRYGESVKGGGIYCLAPALIHNCIITSNKALRYEDGDYPYGGGIYAGEGTRIIGNIIRDNRAYAEYGGDWNTCDRASGYGGGVYAWKSILENNIIEENGSWEGAGLNLTWGIARGNIFQNNIGLAPEGYDCFEVSRAAGAAVYYYTILENNQFLGNTAFMGSELMSDWHTIIRYNLFTQKEHSPYGMSVDFGRWALVENNTFVQSPEAYSSIWGNFESIHWKKNIFVNINLGEALIPPTKKENLTPTMDEESSPSPSLSENILYGSSINRDLSDRFPAWEDSNLIADPLFCDSDEGDFRLSPDSPALPINNPYAWPDTIGALGVGCDVVSILVWGLEGEWTQNGVELSWYLSADVDGEGVHIDRIASSGSQTIRLTDSAVPICTACTFTDPDPPAGVALQYILNLVQPNGNEMILGTLDMTSRPHTISLSRPRPCPSTGSTTLKLQAPVGTEATLVVYDAMGRRVRTLHDGPTLENPQIITWDGLTQEGNQAATGIYFMKMTKPKQMSQRMLIIR